MQVCWHCEGTEGKFHGAVHADVGVCVKTLTAKRNCERAVITAAWEVLLRGSSHTISYGSAFERMERLKQTLVAAGKPEEYGVPDPHKTYEWRW